MNKEQETMTDRRWQLARTGERIRLDTKESPLHRVADGPNCC